MGNKRIQRDVLGKEKRDYDECITDSTGRLDF
jgi:hypothetical protein